MNEQQLAAILAGTVAGTSTAGTGGSAGAPGGSPATGDADSTLTLNGNNPVAWQIGTPWQDNLGTLFTHAGQSETINSTSTVDTTHSGTTTINYWAAVPATDPTQWLRTARKVFVTAPKPRTTTERRAALRRKQRTKTPPPRISPPPAPE